MKSTTLFTTFGLVATTLAASATTTKIPVFMYVQGNAASVVTANPTATVLYLSRPTSFDSDDYYDDNFNYYNYFRITVGPGTMQAEATHSRSYSFSVSCDITRTIEATCVEESQYLTSKIDYDNALTSLYVDDDGYTYTDLYDYDYTTTLVHTTTTITFDELDIYFDAVTVTAGLDKLAQATDEAQASAEAAETGAVLTGFPTISAPPRPTAPAQTEGESTPTGSAPQGTPSDGAASGLVARGAAAAGVFGVVAVVIAL